MHVAVLQGLLVCGQDAIVESLFNEVSPPPFLPFSSNDFIATDKLFQISLADASLTNEFRSH